MEENNNDNHNELGTVKHVSGMFKTWFIDYASYVILERAVPAHGRWFKASTTPYFT